MMVGRGDIDTYDEASIAVVSLETGEYRVLLEGGSSPRYVSSGHLVYARAGALLAVGFDPEALRVVGAPVLVLQGVSTSPLNGSAQFAVSRDGALLYVPGESWGEERQVSWVDREGTSTPIIETQRAFQHVRLSPDGGMLSLAIDGANSSTWLYDIGRSTLTRLASGWDNEGAIWTPDGRRVTFVSNRAGPGIGPIYWQAADGSGAAEQLTQSVSDQSNFVHYPGAWSSDGRLLVFNTFAEGTADIWILSMESDRTSQPFLRTKSNERNPVLSPNDRWLAYQSDESGRDEIYVQPFPDPGRKWQVSSDGGTDPRWSPTGKELFYRNGDEMIAVDVRTDGELRLGTPVVLFEKPYFPSRFYDVTPDGQRFVMVERAEPIPAPTHLVFVDNWAEELKRLVPTPLDPVLPSR